MAAYHSQNPEKKAHALTAETILKQITLKKEKHHSELTELKPKADPEEKIGEKFAKKGGLIPPTLLQKPLEPEQIS